MKVVIFGATGMVGAGALREALNSADVARREHMTRARVTQLMHLLELDAAVLAAVEQAAARGVLIGERSLRSLVGRGRREQQRAFRRLGRVP